MQFWRKINQIPCHPASTNKNSTKQKCNNQQSTIKKSTINKRTTRSTTTATIKNQPLRLRQKLLFSTEWRLAKVLSSPKAPNHFSLFLHAWTLNWLEVVAGARLEVSTLKNPPRKPVSTIHISPSTIPIPANHFFCGAARLCLVPKSLGSNNATVIIVNN